MHRHMRQQGSRAVAGVVVRPRILAFNMALLAVLAGLLAYFVIQANAGTAFQYDIGARTEQLANRREAYHDIGARIAKAEHPDRLAAFAEQAGMVLASDAAYVAVPEPLAGR